MSAGKKILAGLSGDAVRWVESLSRKLSESFLTDTPEKVASDMGQKLINLDKNAPQMFDIYENRPLYYALKEAERGEINLGLIDPDTFRRAAAPIPRSDPYIRDMVDENVRYLRDLYQSGIGYADVPFLSHSSPSQNIAQIVGHEGRHRSRALAAEGEPDQLVRFIPQRSPPYYAPEKLLSDLDSEKSQVYSQESPYSDSKPIGALKDLVKFLSVPASAGALSQLEQEASE
jgi:hypothetical protein